MKDFVAVIGPGMDMSVAVRIAKEHNGILIVSNSDPSEEQPNFSKPDFRRGIFPITALPELEPCKISIIELREQDRGKSQYKYRQQHHNNKK